MKWLEAGGVQVVPIIVNGSIDQTDYFREVDIIIILMNMIMLIIMLVKILILLIQMFTSLNGLMIPGGPDSSILPDAGVHSYTYTRSLGALQAPTSSLRPFGPA